MAATGRQTHTQTRGQAILVNRQLSHGPSFRPARHHITTHTTLTEIISILETK
jgi:hypothetical protein